MEKKLLPIGSIVMLKDIEEKVMIVGHYAPVEHDDNFDMCDYSGCIYPEGTSKTDNVFGFDEDNIEKVIYIGYEENNEEEVEIVSAVNNIFKNIINDTNE